METEFIADDVNYGNLMKWPFLAEQFQYETSGTDKLEPQEDREISNWSSRMSRRGASSGKFWKIAG